jgi:putative DNA primase/helicase
MQTIYDAARKYVAAGVSVIPVQADGSKAPLLAGWREYAKRLPTDAELVTWFGGDRKVGIGVVMGAASGNLVVLDFECKGGRDAYSEWLADLDKPLADAIAVCPVVRTPSGGRHVWVRLPQSVPGGKLARYAGKGETKVEVRGEGHQVLAPGCPAECHESGKTYEFESRGWLSC